MDKSKKIVDLNYEIDLESLIIERLANYAHKSWSEWMKYLFSKSCHYTDGTVVIPKELVTRWTRQIKTDYPELPEDEKQSDRDEACKILQALKHGQL
jgi:hypothetical protein